MSKFNIGDKVRVIYAGSQSWAESMTGIVIQNNYSKYDYRVRLDNPAKTELYFYEDDLLPLENNEIEL